jgi:hypothetical protein
MAAVTCPLATLFCETVAITRHRAWVCMDGLQVQLLVQRWVNVSGSVSPVTSVGVQPARA